MTQPVAVPLWLLVLIIAFAMLSFASHFLFPSVRWFLRRRVERAVARLNQRLQRPIDLFKLAERQDRIARLAYDPAVMQAVSDHAAATGMPLPVAFEDARRYAREIVPGFSTTLYFGVAIRLARWLSRLLYRVRFGRLDPILRRIDPNATVIFVMNHRSNMDYVLVTWLVSGQATISYAVGEWARIWPLKSLIRSMGAYFIRRNSRSPLYRRVLARYVQMATQEGITQAIFLEGGLSLTGAVGIARLGLLSYIVAGHDPVGRDVVFVPVGLGYDRVLEDGILLAAQASGTRAFRMRPLSVLAFAAGNVGRMIIGRFHGFGTAAAAFGAPISLRAYLGQNAGATTEMLGQHLMQEILRVVPVVPVPLVAAALLTRPAHQIALMAEVGRLTDELAQHGAILKLAPQGQQATVSEALRVLRERGLVDADLGHTDAGRALLSFYAAPVQQRLSGKIAGLAEPGA